MPKPNINIGDMILFDRRSYIAGEKNPIPFIEGTCFDLRHSVMAPDKDLWSVDFRDVNEMPHSAPAEYCVNLKHFRIGGGTTIDRNQGNRDATICARIDNEILIEYEMPKGTTALVVIDITKKAARDKNISYLTLPKRWILALADEENGTGLHNLSWNPQRGGDHNGEARKRAEKILQISQTDLAIFSGL